MKNKMAQIYSFIFALLPVLDTYSLGVEKVNVAQILLIIAFPMAMVTLLMIKNNNKMRVNGQKYKVYVQPILFLSAILTITLISLMFLSSTQYSIPDIGYRVLRLALWALSITIVGRTFFSYRYAKKWIIRISIAAVTYIIIQSIMWYLRGDVLPSLVDIPFLNLIYDGASNLSPAEKVLYYLDFYFRPSSFFIEPAYFSYYVILGLVLTLIPEKKDKRLVSKDKKVYILPVFFTVGILLSTSTGGIYIAALVWMIYIFLRLRSYGHNRRVSKSVIFIMLLIILLGISLLVKAVFDNTTGLSNVSITESILNKPFNSFSSGIRLGGSYSQFNQLEGAQRIFGVGFGNEDIYLNLDTKFLNGVTIFMLSTGYLGLFAFIIFAMSLIRISRKHAISLSLAMIYVILCFTESMVYSTTSIVYLTIIYYMPRIEIEKKQIHLEL